jgi:hypothetical protein
VEFVLGYDAVCCSFVFITSSCVDWRMEHVGGSTSRCIVQLLLVLREGVCAMLILIDMEDFRSDDGKYTVPTCGLALAHLPALSSPLETHVRYTAF